VLTATLTLAATTIPTKAEAADLFIPRGPVIPRAPVAYGGGGCGCQVRVPLLRRPAVLRHHAVSTVTAVGMVALTAVVMAVAMPAVMAAITRQVCLRGTARV
jgi:hypothetical protein